ncbi:MAG: PIN domain-containing protein [Acidobacteriota bacterium]|nr:PIN domain-containing protein [Acidobacteriota bacterium]
MSRYLCDTSCLVAAVCTWHEHHARTRAEIESRSRDHEDMVLAAHTLAETYAVLTRLPPLHRLRAADALSLIEMNWGGAPVIQLTDSDTWRALREAPQFGIAGGQTYDALVVAAAIKAGASVLLTWNLRNFSQFSGRISICAPV